MVVAIALSLPEWPLWGQPLAGPASPGVAERRIVWRPIPFGDQRYRLTLAYIRQHYDPQAEDIMLVPRMVVIHWTGSDSLQSVLATFTPAVLPAWRPDIRQAGAVNVSAQFVVDRDGTIYQLMPECWMARHTFGLNRLAIGLENVGGPQAPLTTAQVAANAWLVRDLVARYPTIDFLIGHHEYGRFRHTPLWQERDPTYFSGKQDPGPLFMRQLRQALPELPLWNNYVAGKRK
jgi:N-acetyl-anhydromuramyl-L-alanine amidase AmpD